MKTESDFDAFINEVNPMVVIGGLTYLPSQVLKAVDPIAYQCCFNDWSDEE